MTDMNIPFSNELGLNEYKLLMKTGPHIDTIYTKGSFNDELSVTNKPHKCIGDIFSDQNNAARYYFDKFDDEYQSLYRVVNPNETEMDKYGQKKKYLNRYSNVRFSYDSTEKIKAALSPLKKVAEFGDVAKQQTRVDENIRKGFDVVIDQKNVVTNITDTLREMFYEKTGIRNIRVEPYKINIYEKGDFFTEHRDSPSRDLIATIVLHVDGEYDSMIIDGRTWKSIDGNVLIFYSDVLHEVKPVVNYRETMTFKVFITKTLSDVITPESCGSKMIFSPGIGDIAQKIAKRINISKQFGILLQNGYTYLDIEEYSDFDSDEKTLKGVDNDIIGAIKELDLKYRFVPVITKDVEMVDEYSNYYSNSSESDSDSESDESSSEHVKTRFSPSHKKPTYEGFPDEIDNLSIYNICAQLREKIHCSDEAMSMPVYYLGKGFRVGERTRRNVYIGNQYSGHVEENIYLNILIVVG
ncbi:MAG: hypothetical protein Terrestrivirus5_36 [Terrestrivirus sp.]|uniref:Fe2OG dioxygenase domain-containing protein n=1 Tax=Terrestrivirus sp. TaxID=2487775 RepID=A0A3G4ZP82_9VIRU|nr:MAG: hypothetical protein Terrestrivirus5_36 [Terrestrivirus sp.]